MLVAKWIYILGSIGVSVYVLLTLPYKATKSDLKPTTATTQEELSPKEQAFVRKKLRSKAQMLLER